MYKYNMYILSMDGLYDVPLDSQNINSSFPSPYEHIQR